MTGITVNLPDERLAKLRERAEAYGVSPEELVRASIDHLIGGLTTSSKRQQAMCLKRMRNSTEGSLDALPDGQ